MHAHLWIPGTTLTVSSYSCLGVLAALTAASVLFGAGVREGYPKGRLFASIAVASLLALAGGRLHFVVSEAVGTHVAQSSLPAAGGLHAAGGLIALVLGLPAALRALGFAPRAYFDLLLPALMSGFAVLRIGCFLHGCCGGIRCDGPWCVTYPRESFVFFLPAHAGLVTPTAARSAPVHALPLYFALIALCVAGVGWRLLRRRHYQGQVALLCTLLFGASSFTLEFIRADTPSRVYWGPWPQLAWTALGVSIVSGVGLLSRVAVRRRAE
jgi:phosphatidylglycerol:prolipoprotein diacylglycerol transferase